MARFVGEVQGNRRTLVKRAHGPGVLYQLVLVFKVCSLPVGAVIREIESQKRAAPTKELESCFWAVCLFCLCYFSLLY
uniref:Uncharacterized protein n=1 Tax=Anguilla anguilla TaxID=7936 RepID=A0A0E9XWQ4_ANGAN